MKAEGAEAVLVVFIGGLEGLRDSGVLHVAGVRRVLTGSLGRFLLFRGPVLKRDNLSRIF